MKRSFLATASASALTVASLYVVCRVFVGLFPTFSYVVIQAWFHGLISQNAARFELTWPSFLLGLLSATIVAWLAGWCFAHCYNMFARKSK